MEKKKKLPKKESRVKVFLNNHKLFKTLLITFCFFVIVQIFTYFMDIEYAKLTIPRSYHIACLEVDMQIDRKQQNHYCKCRKDVMKQYLKSLNVFLFFDKIKDDKEFSEIANKKCGSIDKIF